MIAAAVAFSAAFAPSAHLSAGVQTRHVAMSAADQALFGRRELIQTLAAGAALSPLAAFADGASTRKNPTLCTSWV